MIAFRSAGTLLQLKNATGLQAEKTLATAAGANEILPNSWSTDDAQILCSVQSSATSAHGDSQLVLVSVADGTLTPFMPGPASLSAGQISPDGRWVAYASNETGDWEIYVTTFPGAAGKWQVSHGGGTEPRWSRDGKHVYYLGLKGMLTGVPVETAGGFSSGVPQQLFQTRSRAPISSADLFSYDVAADGRFLVNRYVTPAHAPPLNIILNATAPQ